MRFPEFTEEWSIKTIGEILSIGSGRDYKQLEPGDTPVFGTGGLMTYVNQWLMDGESVFIGRKGTINRPFYYCGKFWTVDTLFYSHSFINVIPKFVLYLFEAIDWMKYNEASGVPSLSKSTIERIIVKLPSIIEQTKIAELLTLLDERIATQSKIIEDLEQLKSAIIDKMIGKLTMRTDLQIFATIYDRAGEGGTPDTTKPKYYEPGEIPFIKIEDLTNKYIVTNKDYISNLGLTKSSAWIVPKNSIIYSNGATIGAVSINTYPIATKQGILGIVPKRGVAAEYLYYLMNSTYFKKQIHRVITHGTMATAYLKDINRIKVPIPSVFNQTKVTNYLSMISEKIEVEQGILSYLRSQKQYLLRQMFI